MTREQRNGLASLMIRGAGNIVEEWDVICADVEFQAQYPDVAQLTQDEVRVTLAKWMNELPGDSWDERLGDE